MGDSSAKKHSRSSCKILVTAGPTIEPLDPVRFISNRSTGIMGYAIAAECSTRGLDVCLISGPVGIAPPEGVEVIRVDTALEMRDEVMKRIDDCGGVVMAAAVCDFRPKEPSGQKIKKTEELTLDLVKNPDILREIGKREGLVKVGFALETENAIENAQEKLKEKDLDLIVVNVKTKVEDPFGDGVKKFVLIGRDKNIAEHEGLTKKEMAGVIVDALERLLT